MQVKNRKDKQWEFLGDPIKCASFIAQMAVRSRRGHLEVSRQGENYNDQENQSEASTGRVPPTGTIRPSWERPDQKEH
jgi:hypothetical protein